MTGGFITTRLASGISSGKIGTATVAPLLSAACDLL